MTKAEAETLMRLSINRNTKGGKSLHYVEGHEPPEQKIEALEEQIEWLEDEVEALKGDIAELERGEAA